MFILTPLPKFLEFFTGEDCYQTYVLYGVISRVDLFLDGHEFLIALIEKFKCGNLRGIRTIFFRKLSVGILGHLKCV